MPEGLGGSEQRGLRRPARSPTVDCRPSSSTCSLAAADYVRRDKRNIGLNGRWSRRERDAQTAGASSARTPSALANTSASAQATARLRMARSSAKHRITHSRLTHSKHPSPNHLLPLISKTLVAGDAASGAVLGVAIAGVALVKASGEVEVCIQRLES